MGKSVACDPKLEKVGSHSVSLEYSNGGSVSREECFPVLTATWRGQEIRVQMEANRYVYSDGDWSDWRVFARSCEPNVTDTARQALNEVCRPLVLDWLGSDEYTASRSTAFRHMLQHQLREERYSVDRSAENLQRYGDELTPEDGRRLDAALSHLREFLALVA
jgi:hypothetical protein